MGWWAINIIHTINEKFLSGICETSLWNSTVLNKLSRREGQGEFLTIPRSSPVNLHHPGGKCGNRNHVALLQVNFQRTKQAVRVSVRPPSLQDPSPWSRFNPLAEEKRDASEE
jgi:hypothetical protein